MSDLECPPSTWRKSTASGGGNCVEVSFAGASVLMRNSRSPQGPVLSFTRPEWDAFLTGVRDGEFDAD
jgi:predicted secreted Zn-dependent protease